MKALVCINTCNRLSELRKYLLPYLQFTRDMSDFDFLLALDGNNKEYLSFCTEYEIPLLYSDDREGVGLSKNRVLMLFPEYDFYFFLDDDVELFESSIFLDHVNFSRLNPNVHHLSSTDLYRIENEELLDGQRVIYGNKGGGYFNFFTKRGLEQVGGWHTDFAQWKRYGHTEHSYRFVHAGLQNYPLVVLANSISKVIIHSPEHVSKPLDHLVDPENELFEHEKNLIAQRITHFPITTLSPFRFNGMSVNEPGNDALIKLLGSGDRYNLITNAKDKRNSRVAYKVHKLGHTKSISKKIKLLFEILYLAPTNNSFKHWIKQILRSR